MVDIKKIQKKNIILEKKPDNTRKMTRRFLKQAKKIDFGKNWIEEMDLLSCE